MLERILTRGVLTLCALLVAGTAVATYIDVEETQQSNPQTQSGPFRFDAPQAGDRELGSPYQRDVGMGQFDAFATPDVNEYGQTKSNPDAGAPAIVPEPGSTALLAGGLAALAVRRMRRRAA